MRVAALAVVVVVLCSAAGACGRATSGASPRTVADARPARVPPTGVQPAKPRLVVSVIIDQLGSATLQKLEPLLAADGLLAHVRREGVVYEHVVYPFAATLTAP